MESYGWVSRVNRNPVRGNLKRKHDIKRLQKWSLHYGKTSNKERNGDYMSTTMKIIILVFAILDLVLNVSLLILSCRKGETEKLTMEE